VLAAGVDLGGMPVRSNFGTTRLGDAVDLLTLQSGEMLVRILTFGAVLQDVRLAGVAHSLTLGSPVLAAYEGPFASFGSVMGPVANRISNARALLAGRQLHFEANLPGGHLLHSGACGLQHKVWSVIALSHSSVTLKTTASDGEGGFPGARSWEVCYTLTDPATLTLDIRAQTDALTLMNPVNHSYWNLDGSPTHDGHVLKIEAQNYLPLDEGLLPTGQVAPVAGTPLDFRQARAIGPQDALDFNFCLTQGRGPLRGAARLRGRGGIEMKLETTDPGLQVYDGKSIYSQGFVGHHGAPYVPRAGLALEAQFWPDAANNPHFPAITLDAAELWHQTTRFSFRKL
jgi:aldose 1-epimerase